MPKLRIGQNVYIVCKVSIGFPILPFYVMDPRGQIGTCPVFTNKKKAKKYAKGLPIIECFIQHKPK